MSRAINYVLNNREQALQRVVQLYNRAFKKHAKKRAQQ